MFISPIFSSLNFEEPNAVISLTVTINFLNYVSIPNCHASQTRTNLLEVNRKQQFKLDRIDNRISALLYSLISEGSCDVEQDKHKREDQKGLWK